MLFYTAASKALGLDGTGLVPRGAVVSFKRGKLILTDLISSDVKLLDIGYKNFDYPHAALITSLATSQLLIKEVEIPIAKGKKIEALLKFQAEPLLPYPIDQALLAFSFNQRIEDKLLFTLFATRHDFVRKHLDQFEADGIEPQVVSCIPAALAAFNQILEAPPGAKWIGHFAQEGTTLLLLINGKIAGCHFTSKGQKECLEGLAKDLSYSSEEAYRFFLAEANFSSFRKEKYPCLMKFIQEWQSEVAKILLAFHLEHSESPQDLILCGEIASLPHFEQLLDLEYLPQIHKPHSPIFSQLDSRKLQQFAVAIGLALQALPSSEEQVNFLQGELSPCQPFAFLKKNFVIYYALCFLLTLLLFFAGQQFLNQKELELENKARVILSIYHFQDEDIDTDGLTTKEKAEEILAHSLKSPVFLYPLFPQIPRIQDFLGWFESHAALSNLFKEGIEEQQPAVIERLSYQLVKKPSKKKPKEPYRAKVEVEFKAGSSSLGREVHEILLKAPEMIDLKEGVQWSCHATLYRTSFFLKDKTSYY